MHTVFIDYLQYSAMESEARLIEEEAEMIRPIPFFKRGYRDALGIRYYYGHSKTDKTSVIMDGAAMHNQRAVGWSDFMTLEHALMNDGEIKRMDIAITDYVHDDLILPADVAESVLNGEITGTLANDGAKFIASLDDHINHHIETLYIGDMKRRGKRGIFRAYDKGLDLDLEKYMITRLELEERKKNAHNSAKRLLDGATHTQVLQSRLQFNGKRYERIMEDEPIDISRGQALEVETEDEKMNKRYEWMMNQVAPAVREFTDYERNRGASDEKTMKFLRACGIIE